MGKALVSLVLIPLIGYVLFYLNDKMEFVKSPVTYTEKFNNCRYLDQETPGPEDITRYNDTTLIFGQADLGPLFGLGDPQATLPGAVYAIYEAHTDNFLLKELKIHGWPEGNAYHPHGIFIATFDNVKYLYTVNHAFNEFGERVERFRIENGQDGFLELHHEFSVVFPLEEFNGKLNDVVAVSHTHFFVTQWQIYPMNLKGHKHDSAWQKFKTTFFWVTMRKYANFYSCTIPNTKSKTQVPTCHAVEGAEGVINNGMHTDGTHLYVADTMAKTIKQYSGDLSGHKLTLKRTFQLAGSPDNVEYHPHTNKLLVAALPRISDFFKYGAMLANNNGRLDKKELIGFWTGVEEIDLSEKEPVSRPLLVQIDIQKSTSGAYEIGDNLFLASYSDQSLVVCKRRKQ